MKSSDRSQKWSYKFEKKKHFLVTLVYKSQDKFMQKGETYAVKNTILKRRMDVKG